MKFVGYCSSVMKSFGSNFASIISTEEKLITPETEDLLNLSDVKSVKMLSQMLSNKTVQQSSTLLWIFPETTDWTLTTLKATWGILKGEDLGTMSNNKGLFPNFFVSPEIIFSRQFKRCPL